MTKTKKKSQKPIEIDAHFRYKCPSIKCGYDHWLSLKEIKTKNFKVVCDCGKVFRPKRVKNIKLVFEKPEQVKQIKQELEVPPRKTESISIPVDIQSSCVRLLVGYGFTKTEAITLIEKAYVKHPVTSGSLLVKYILQHLEELSVIN